uniref:Uncharacterized protein n=1 Tax=Tanacetum cinerariifolium TaxID=118510 RepID=A0A6L2NUU7_TANCI|nr:hypothetical protein [Tanacetum cinerariifolium]
MNEQLSSGLDPNLMAPAKHSVGPKLTTLQSGRTRSALVNDPPTSRLEEDAVEAVSGAIQVSSKSLSNVSSGVSELGTLVSEDGDLEAEELGVTAGAPSEMFVVEGEPLAFSGA